MIDEGMLVFPGDKLATAEELLPGRGTADINGNIIGTMMGMFQMDKNHTVAEVKPVTSIPVELHEGDTVICEVKHVMDKLVLVDVLHVAGTNRHITGDKDGAIPVPDIAREYVASAKDKFKIGDITRAKVTQAGANIRLTTIGKNLGVIKSYCTDCRAPLIQPKEKGTKLECPRCGHPEERQIAVDYGEGNLDLR
jgi:exosome complex component CSL4